MHSDVYTFGNDARDRAAMSGGAKLPSFTRWPEDPNADEEEVFLPWAYGVCDLCHGEGTHVNPSIDANGLSARDFDEDPEFREAYFNGAYDVPCNECHGKRVVPVVNEAACDPELLAEYHGYLRDEADSLAERLAEIRMGA